MKYNFDSCTSRIGTNSIKWKFADENKLNDFAPLWIADMDFDVLPEITEALVNRAKHPIYGYTVPSEEIYDEIISWQKRHHNIDIKKEEIIFSTGVVHSYGQMLDTFLAKDEKVIVNSPIYPPFFGTPDAFEREVVYSPMIEVEGGWKFDFEGFEKLIKEDKKIRMFNLCNPYNPLNVNWTLEELNRMMEICHRYGLYVSSDEIHSDLIMPGFDFVSALKVNKEFQDKLIVSFSPTKTFNIAGLEVSYVVIPNKEIREQFNRTAHGIGLSSINIFGYEALLAAYKNGDEWLKEATSYMYENFKFVKQYLNERMPMANLNIPEATYLGLLDLRNIDLPEDLADRLMKEAHVQFNPGQAFHADHRCLRINVACPRAQLEKGLEALRNWLTVNKYI